MDILIPSVLDAALSLQEDTILGGFKYGFAILVCLKIVGGRKSVSQGIALSRYHSSENKKED